MASTSSPNFWQNLRDNVTGLAIDYARAKYLDVERPDDDRNVPDRADLKYDGLFYATKDGTRVVTPAGSALQWGLVAVAVLGGFLLLRKVL